MRWGGIGRRKLLTSIATLASTALLSRGSSAQVTPARDKSHVSAKEFGARGDFANDDTRALQAAVDDCFGNSARPHGTTGVVSNKVLLIPAGRYRITSPLEIAKLQGGRVLGDGRFVTQIVNVAGGPAIVTNGCAYSHFEGMYLQSQGTDATVFDLNWDGSAGGAALQSNTFIDMFFDGGAVGVDIGAGGFMGSENLFVNCFWIDQRSAALKTSNFNALQNSLVGGNIQNCNIGVWVERGSVRLVESVGFQLSKVCDIRIDNSANDTIAVVACRTESSNFLTIKNGVHAYIASCSQAEAAGAGYVLQANGCPITVERCVSLKGQVVPSAGTRLTVRGCSFGRTDWLDYSALGHGEVEVEDVQYGGTPNSPGEGRSERIGKQRISQEGVFNYKVVRAG